MVTETDEQTLAQKAKNGDADAFEDIVRRFEKQLYNVSLRMLGNPQDAADAVQETFLKAYTALPGFRGESKLSVWLYRIARNVCVDALRKRRETVSLTNVDEEGKELEWEIPDNRYDPAALVERADLHQAVRAAIDCLPADQKQALILREFGELSYEEIGETLSLDIGTVKSRIFRARKKLCALLSPDGNFSDKQTSKRRKGGAGT